MGYIKNECCLGHTGDKGVESTRRERSSMTKRGGKVRVCSEEEFLRSVGVIGLSHHREWERSGGKGEEKERPSVNV